LEGAGVHLHRAFGFHEVPRLDPFLLLDDFRSDDPAHFLPGFPWHPHRGIETITYILEGRVEHGDSLGNRGVIGPGDVQWMTAGNGVIHQEMPKGDTKGHMGGFQLWANLPKSHKMMDPRYRDVKASTIPEVVMEGGAKVKVISGIVEGVQGPVRDIVAEIMYLDVKLEHGGRFELPVKNGFSVFAYVYEGAFETGSDLVPAGSLVVLGDGDRVVLKAGAEGACFLMAAGRPLKEPVAWRGPIVMNTPEELQVAFDELEEGTFLRHVGQFHD
jgi:redox-sensitive bicupin YhaK (pirin superfamily)